MDEREVKTVPNIMIDCPLLKKQIADGMCCDIMNAARGDLKKSAIREQVDWELAKTMCEDCPVSWLTIEYPK